MVAPDATARRVLHAFPHQRFRVQAVLHQLLRVEDRPALAKMRADRRVRIFQIAQESRFGEGGRTADAEEVLDAPLDDVGVQEERVGTGFVGGIGLDHPDPVEGAVDECGDDFVRDMVIRFFERFEGHGESVLVAPAGPALAEERVEVLGSVIVVIQHQAEALWL